MTAAADGGPRDDDRRRHLDVERIAEALDAAAEVLEPFEPGAVEAGLKEGDDPVTAADLAVDRTLRRLLPQRGEGWLSEETADDGDRLARHRVWVVDPLDGTREFVAGIPEWCVSVGLVEGGRPVAGGLLNPASGVRILGAVGWGVVCNGEPVRAPSRSELRGARVLASRSEVQRGEWEGFEGCGFDVVPTGSVAYKLGLVAAGEADATWTLVPKHEWDVAAGVALVLAAGGETWVPPGSPDRDPESRGESPAAGPGWAFNRARPRLPGLVAHAPGLRPAVEHLLFETVTSKRAGAREP